MKPTKPRSETKVTLGLADRSQNAALKALREQTSVVKGTVGLPSNTQTLNATPPDPTLSDKVLPALAYGEFVKQVGLAVAQAQSALDENSVKQALILATKDVQTLLAVVQEVDENGQIKSVTTDVQPLPLITQIQPTFYQFTKVDLFARFDVSDISSDGTVKVATSATSTTSAKSGNFSGNLSGGFNFGKKKGGNISGGLGGGRSNSSSSSTASSTTDISTESNVASSSGSSFMHATLEPRTDSSFFEPIVVTNGPQLSLSAPSATLARGDSGASVVIDLTLNKSDGTALEKHVAFNLKGPGTLDQTVVKTDSTGKGVVTLSVQSTDAPGTATVSAALGVLKAAVSIVII